MAQLLAEFRLRVQTILSPAEVLAALNQDLVARSQAGVFCTLHYVTLDLDSGTIASANDSNFTVLRIGNAGSAPFGEASGPPLGILRNAQWSETQSTLERGEALLLYSDGIVEARMGTALHRRRIQRFGIEGIGKALEREPGAAPDALSSS